MGAEARWHVCPGCGVSLPGPLEKHGRRNASEACWQLYGEVAAHELANLATLGRLHQLMVDTYGAQHAGGSGESRLGVAFALIGLSLALDHGWSGTDVRDAHRYLATTAGDWPAFAPPTRRASLTVYGVALAASPDEHADLIDRWAADVWASWQPAYADVAALIDERLPADVQARFGPRSRGQPPPERPSAG